MDLSQGSAKSSPRAREHVKLRPSSTITRVLAAKAPDRGGSTAVRLQGTGSCSGPPRLSQSGPPRGLWDLESCSFKEDP